MKLKIKNFTKTSRLTIGRYDNGAYRPTLTDKQDGV